MSSLTDCRNHKHVQKGNQFTSAPDPVEPVLSRVEVRQGHLGQSDQGGLVVEGSTEGVLERVLVSHL